VHTPLGPQPRRSVRMDAGLDTKTRAKLETLAMGFQRSRAAGGCPSSRHSAMWAWNTASRGGNNR
jgi:hypothetical protein